VSSRIDTLEPNSEPLAILLASIVARISAQDFAQPCASSPENRGDDIAGQAQRALAGIPLGVAQSGHRPRLIAMMRSLVGAHVRAGAPVLERAPRVLAAGVSLLRDMGAHTFERLRERAASALRLRPARISRNAAIKIGAGLAVAALGLSLAIMYSSGRFTRTLSPSDGGGPTAQTQAPDAGQFAEERPLRNAGLEFTRANLRYCTFQQIRLETLGPITEGADLVVFNALVEDWNGRCTKQRSRAEDKEAVDAEAARRRALLEVEGRALMNVWRRKIVTTVEQLPAVAGFDAGEAAAPAGLAATAAPEQTGDGVERLPLLITLGRASADEPDRDTGFSLRTPSLALMRAEVAMRVQRRLNDLGYTIAVDGTWGSASRAALRRFKKANGLLGSDAFDAETVTRLFSTMAVAAAAGQQLEDGTASIETAYPPPPAADMNPLNRSDGQRIQKRLAELGYYNGRGEGAWDTAARTALRRFKAANGLGNSEDWDAPAETVLFDDQAVRAADATASDPRKSAVPPAAAAVPLPPKRPAPSAKTVESAGTPPRNGAARPAPRP